MSIKRSFILMLSLFLLLSMFVNVAVAVENGIDPNNNIARPDRGDRNSNGGLLELFEKALNENIITESEYAAIKTFIEKRAAEIKEPPGGSSGEEMKEPPSETRDPKGGVPPGNILPEGSTEGGMPDRNKDMLSEFVTAGLITQEQSDKIAALVFVKETVNEQSKATQTPIISKIKVFINGQERNFSSEPQIKDGSTLVPMRSIFEILGCEVQWDQTTKTVTGNKNGKTIKLVIGNKTAYVNSEQKTLAVEAQLINGATYVPLRFVSEALGAEITWENGVIYINTADN